MKDNLFTNLLPNELPQKAKNRSTKLAKCHPERKHQANGLCRICYARSRYVSKSTHLLCQKSVCHPDRKHYAKGLCKLCYTRNRLIKYRAMPDKIQVLREKQRLYKQLQRANNPENARAKRHAEKSRRKGCEGSYTGSEFESLKDKYNRCCISCGRNEEELIKAGLQIVPDHVYPLLPKSGPKGINYIWNIQPLCHGIGGCNNSKHNRYKDYRPIEDQRKLLTWLFNI